MLLASTSLALASLGWCAREFAPETTTDDLIRRLSVLDTEALAPFSQAALREAAQELLEAVSDTDHEGATPWVQCIGGILPDASSLSQLDVTLGGTPEEWRGLLDAEGEDEREVIVAARLIVWLRRFAPEASEPPSLERLLALGWTAPGCKESRCNFYRSYCLALHDRVRRSIDELDPVLLGARLEGHQWLEWLGAEAGLPVIDLSDRRRVLFGAPTIAAATAALLSGLWWLAIKPGGIERREQGSQQQAGKSAADVSPAPGVTPGVSLSATPAPVIAEAPAPAPPPDPITHANLLIVKAKKELAEGNTEAADSDARSAQELLDALLPAHDVKVGDAFRDLGEHWENRQLWPEAVRVLQKSVKAYEGTPAENAGPQFEAVNRWAGALRRTGRLTEAEKLYRTLLQAYEGTGPALEVDEATVAHNLANALVDNGRFKDARGYYERALALLANHWPTEDEAQRLAGVMGQNYQHCLVALGFPEKEALAQTRRLLKLPPPTGGK